MSARADSTPPLAGMLGAGPPELGVRGRALILAIYGFGAAVFALAAPDLRPGRLVVPALGAAIFAGAAFVAESVRRYRCWAWFFVMGWLALVFAPALLLVPGEFRWPAPVSYAAAGMVLGWIHWLWTRRGDFLPDPRIDALRRRRRWVTADWRAARLARIGAGAALPRHAMHVAGAHRARRYAPGS